MANKVFANGREIACKAADGKSIGAFPDVCFTPPQTPATPPGVPIPYPNTAYAKDTTKGSKTVKISNKEVMLKNKSHFKKSTGNEAGRAPKKGIVTSKIQGKVYFTSWSPNVKVEGKNVVRHLDLTTHNHGSSPGQTPSWPYTDSMNIGQNNGCDEAGKKASEADKQLTPKMKEDSYVVAGAVFVPTTGKAISSIASSRVSSSLIVRGKKYKGFSKSVGKNNPSNVRCNGKNHEYAKSDRPYEGHAEAKIIESLFSNGIPKGTLYLKVVGKNICDECEKLIKCAKESINIEIC